MANAYMDSSLLDRAINFAVKAHSNTERRGKGFPYVVHVCEAMEIVATMTADQELLAAAVLHDTVEDTEVTIDEIHREFGARVAALVDAESDRFTAGVSETDSWRDRKQAAIDRIAASSKDAKMVALGDKLSNARAIWRDYEELGDALWDRFHAPGGKPDHEWHYRSLARSLSELSDTFAYKEFVSLIDRVFDHSKPVRVNMEDYERSGDGFTALSYSHKDGKTMIKLYEPFIPQNVPARERRVAAAVAAMGIPTPGVGNIVTDGQRTGVEFERIKPKKSFARAISEDPSKLEFYALEFAHRCRDLHNTPCDTEAFASTVDRFKGIVLSSAHYDDEQKAHICKFIDSVPKRTTCIHGDLHIGNIIFNPDNGRQYWIDLADFGYGNPWFDLGMFYLVCKQSPKGMAMKLFHLPDESMSRIWDIFVKEYFGANADPDQVAYDVSPFTALMMIQFENQGTLVPEMKSFIVKSLLER